MHNYGIDNFTKDGLVDDTLHTMALGIEADWNGTSMMRLLQKNFSNSTRTTKHEKFEDGLACFRTRLKTYYKNGHDANPDYKWSRIDRLTLKMLGKENNPTLKAKGGETNDITLFVLGNVRSCATLDPLLPHLVQAGQELQNIKGILRQFKRKIPVPERHVLMTSCVRFLTFAKIGLMKLKPKAHRFMHMIRNIGKNGNPRTYGTWWDEHDNGIIAGQAKTVHARHFSEGSFLRILAKETLG